ncbi:MAG: hypothetical protein R3F11_25630 [Verrucomicrobiales bacterium]
MCRCSAEGSATGNIVVGGLVGEILTGPRIEDAYTLASVTGSDLVGGLVGSLSEAYVIRAYSAGPVSGATRVGGLIGRRSFIGDSTVQASFWDTATSGQAQSAAGTGLATAALYQRSTFQAAGWDFVSVWFIRNGSGYPTLRRAWIALDVPPPTIVAWGEGAAGFQLVCTAGPGFLYTLERSDALAGWTAVASKIATGDTVTFEGQDFGSLVGRTASFFRVKVSNP